MYSLIAFILCISKDHIWLDAKRDDGRDGSENISETLNWFEFKISKVK